MSVIPRGKVKTAAAKGDVFVLEIEAPVTLEQALSFYQSQLPRDRWEGLQILEAGKGLWSFEARRGMFLLTGTIRAVDPQRVSIRFERRQEEKVAGWIPPVPPDIITLPDSITWDDRVFDAGGSRVELRGQSQMEAAALRKTLQAALGGKGWTVEPRDPDRLQARKGKEKTLRELLYRVEPLGRGSQVGLSLALEELATKTRATSPAPTDPRPDASIAENLVPVPADLVLWKSDVPPTARHEGDGLLTVTFDRPCEEGDMTEKDVKTRLTKLGWKLLPATAPLPGAQLDRAPTSITASKGRRLVVAIMNRGVTSCSITLMVTGN